MKRFIFILLLPVGLKGYCEGIITKVSVKNVQWITTSEICFKTNWLDLDYLSLSPEKEDYRGIRNKIVHLLLPGILIEDSKIIVNAIKDYLES